MSFDASKYSPKENDWFSTEVEYKGHGRAEFVNPKGWIDGDVTIKFDDNGKSTIEMETGEFFVENIDEGTESGMAILHLLTGAKIFPFLGGSSIGFGTEINNLCEKLTVQCTDGIFLIDKPTFYTYSMQIPGGITVKFQPTVSYYIKSGDQLAKYWVMPLSNFLWNFGWPSYNTPFDNHPLRFYQVPSIEDTFESEEQGFAARYNSYSRNNIITYESKGKFGYIEPLPNFAERKEKLLLDQTKITTTAIMVGELESEDNIQNWEKWVALDYLHLLSLASGSSVGTPWIELRDDLGNLVGRIHTYQWQSPFFKGHTSIDQKMKGGIGLLLTTSPFHLDKHLRVAINQLVKGGQRHFYIEDRLAYLFRAFDTLTSEERTTKQLDTNSSINSSNKEAIKKFLQNASTEIKKLTPSNEIEKKEINRIAQVASGAANNKKPDEAQAVLMLLDNYGLNDAKVIVDLEAWLKQYNKYRNQVIHESFIQNAEGQDAGYLMYHLYDMLLRIILKMINYNEEYNRATLPNGHFSVDWVTPNTSPTDLGYKQHNSTTK